MEDANSNIKKRVYGKKMPPVKQQPMKSNKQPEHDEAKEQMLDAAKFLASVRKTKK